MRLLVVPSASNFLQFLDFLPPEIFVQKCSESYFTSRRGLSHRFWSSITRRRVLRRYSSKFDLIFCEYADKNAAFLSEVVSKPLIIRAHQFEFDYPETTLDGINWSNVECLVVVSNHYKRLAKEMTPARKIEVIQNGVDVNKFSFQPSSSDKVCTFSFHEELVQKLRGFMNMAPPEQLLRKKSLRSIIEQKFNVTEQADKFAKLFLEVADERN